MSVPAKWRQRRDAMVSAVPRVDEWAGNRQAGRIAYHLARNTTVQPHDLRGLGVITTGLPSSSGAHGQYRNEGPEIEVGGSWGKGWHADNEMTGTLVHEIGHHADAMLNPDQFPWGSTGRGEAVAENYADKHMVHPVDSVYDRILATREPGQLPAKWSPDDVPDYEEARSSGETPESAGLARLRRRAGRREK